MRRVQRVEHLAGGVERHELDRHAKPPAELAGEVDRDAARLAGRGVALRQHGVAEIDRGAQAPAGARSLTISGAAAFADAVIRNARPASRAVARRGTQITGLHGTVISR